MFLLHVPNFWVLNLGRLQHQTWRNQGLPLEPHPTNYHPGGFHLAGPTKMSSNDLLPYTWPLEIQNGNGTYINTWRFGGDCTAQYPLTNWIPRVNDHDLPQLNSHHFFLRKSKAPRGMDLTNPFFLRHAKDSSTTIYRIPYTHTIPGHQLLHSTSMNITGWLLGFQYHIAARKPS